MEEAKCFAADLFKEYDQTIRRRTTHWGMNGHEYVIKDPLDGGKLRCKTE